MYKELTPEQVALLEAAFKALGADGNTPIHINRTRICDHCQDEAKEAAPYGVQDSEGRVWCHLCNDCFDSLGCSYGEG